MKRPAPITAISQSIMAAGFGLFHFSPLMAGYILGVALIGISAILLIVSVIIPYKTQTRKKRKRKMKSIATILILLSLNSCTTVPKADPIMDAFTQKIVNELTETTTSSVK